MDHILLQSRLDHAQQVIEAMRARGDHRTSLRAALAAWEREAEALERQLATSPLT